MNTLRAIIAEIVHLFVDDGSLALALVTWCAAVGLALPVLPQLLAISGPTLFLGCATILLCNVVRAPRPRTSATGP